jgi:hypothetical protein
VLLPVVLVYQAWTYIVFRGRMQGPRVGDGGPGPVIPAPRPEHVPAPGSAPASVGQGTGEGRGTGALPVRRLVTGGLTLAWAWLLSRQLSGGQRRG